MYTAQYRREMQPTSQFHRAELGDALSMEWLTVVEDTIADAPEAAESEQTQGY